MGFVELSKKTMTNLALLSSSPQFCFLGLAFIFCNLPSNIHTDLFLNLRFYIF